MDIKDLKIEYYDPKILKPYKNNTRHHEDLDINAIRESIRKFGFADPIGVWSDELLIVEGHGRQLAAIEEGIEKVPCIRLDWMTDEERRAYAIAHNRTAELSTWNTNLLQLELSSLKEMDLSSLKLETLKSGGGTDWFSSRKRYDNEDENESDEYKEFKEKFELKKTTDDCYTPDLVYDAVVEYVEKEYDLKKDNFVRPFYPGGDYTKEEYKPRQIVVDNPPFSIMTEILKFYTERKIKFFLFAPTLTLFTGRGLDICYLPTGVGITYENGASVNTSFITNLEKHRIKTVPRLYEKLYEANKENLKDVRVQHPRYEFPESVVTAAGLSRLSVHGVELTIDADECFRISELDAMKEAGKAIFGGGYLLSQKASIRNREAIQERLRNTEKKERERLQQAIENKGVIVSEGGTVVWQLSQREKDLMATLK